VEPRSRVTIRDVAARAGVSVATVSKVINHRYGVASGTAARVRAVIDDLGYEASLVARSLRNHRTNVIGILVADLEPVSTELLRGAVGAIRGSGFELLVYSPGGDGAGWEQRCLSRLSGTLIDGAVLVAPTVADVSHGAPVVAIDPHTGRPGLPAVASDNLGGARLATAHLLGLGHRRIGMLAGRPGPDSARQREQGYREALRAAGAVVDESLIRVGGDDPGAQARLLLTGPDPPTAIFAASDRSAIAAVGAAAGLGLRVPADLSVAGFGNIPGSAVCAPPLTTVEQSARTMGERSVGLLLALIRGERPAVTHITPAATLVVRQSTRAVAAT